MVLLGDARYKVRYGIVRYGDLKYGKLRQGIAQTEIKIINITDLR